MSSHRHVAGLVTLKAIRLRPLGPGRTESVYADFRAIQRVRQCNVCVASQKGNDFDPRRAASAFCASATRHSVETDMERGLPMRPSKSRIAGRAALSIFARRCLATGFRHGTFVREYDAAATAMPAKKMGGNCCHIQSMRGLPRAKNCSVYLVRGARVRAKLHP